MPEPQTIEQLIRECGVRTTDGTYILLKPDHARRVRKALGQPEPDVHPAKQEDNRHA